MSGSETSTHTPLDICVKEHFSPNPTTTLNHQSLQLRLQAIHQELCSKEGCAPIKHIAVAVYDPANDSLHTFTESNIGVGPVGHYHAHLSDTEALRRLASNRLARVVDNISPDGSERSRQLYLQGLRSSLTVPVHRQNHLFGFIFLNATEPNFFNSRIIRRLTAYTQLIALVLVHKILTARLVRAVARMAQEVSRGRDDETGNHLERMSNYARLIATEGAKLWGLSDEAIEYLFWYAPLHDIGKVAVKDSILLKPGKLTEAEWVEMKLHVVHGSAIIDAMVKEFGLDTIPHIDMARNIIASHHENVDGSGYPAGVTGEHIPIEGRIVAVADVFDALTSDRPYKQRWSNEDAIRYLLDLVGTKFDAECVEAFIRRLDEVVEIQRHFNDSSAYEAGPSREADAARQT